MSENDGAWWCPKCAYYVRPEQVTHQERHQACDCPVIWYQNTDANLVDLGGSVSRLVDVSKVLTARVLEVETQNGGLHREVARLEGEASRLRCLLGDAETEAERFACDAEDLQNLRENLRSKYPRLRELELLDDFVRAVLKFVAELED